MKLKTKTKEFAIVWDGVSDIDGLLRFQTDGGNMQDLMRTFMNAEETATLNVDDDYATVRSYVGYTDFYGIVKNEHGVVVTLGKGESA